MDTQTSPVVTAPAASRCPIDHTAMAKASAAPAVAVEGGSGGCPVMPGGIGERSKADLIARKVLRIKDRPAGVTSAQAYSAFQKSMLISATRCLLTYIVFPFVLPAVGFATGVGPVLGIVIGVLAMTCDVFSIRRFHAVNHRWRWHFTAVALCVIGLLSVLLVQDIVHLVS
jgi:hypothetical protein